MQSSEQKYNLMQLLLLGNAAEEIINTQIPEALRQLVSKVYQQGQDIGVIRGLLRTVKPMQELGAHQAVMAHVTGLSQTDLATWEQVLEESTLDWEALNRFV